MRRDAGWFSLSEPHRHGSRHGRQASASLKPVDPAQFLRERHRCVHRSRPGTPLGDPSPGLSQRPCIQRPTASTGSIPTRFERPKSQEIPRGISGHSGQTRPSPAARKGPAEWSFWNPLGATGGTQTHSRRTGGKLGRLRRARQGLVRVSESNTKYGGKWRKTGAVPRP